MDEVVANKHIPVLIPPDKGSRGTPRRGWTGGRYDWMRRVLATEHGRAAAIENASRPSSRCSATPSTTAASPIPPTRQDQGPHRVAITDDDPQPHQASPPPARHRGGLKRALGTDTPPLTTRHVTQPRSHQRPPTPSSPTVCATASTTTRRFAQPPEVRLGRSLVVPIERVVSVSQTPARRLRRQRALETRMRDYGRGCVLEAYLDSWAGEESYRAQTADRPAPLGPRR